MAPGPASRNQLWAENPVPVENNIGEQHSCNSGKHQQLCLADLEELSEPSCLGQPGYVVMTAGSDDEDIALDRADGRTGSNSPFNGSQSNAQLATEIGRCLQSRYAVPSDEPLPEELAALVQQLREQGVITQQEQSEPEGHAD